MEWIDNIIFTLLLGGGIFWFVRNVAKIRRNINLGRQIEINDNKTERWKLMAKVAIGQSKMVVRPVAGIMHILVYVGFIIINIEVLEIISDGIFGTHRVLAFMGSFYYLLIASLNFWLSELF